MINHIVNALEKVSRNLAKRRVEPQIVQKHNLQGNTYWQIYDPISTSHRSFSSKQEVRAWLDSRYYLGK